ncbi:hypothetical protein H4219_005260 [Mycoemilia scoparia]|uniref:Major facilitator superfamily (MFS) profile domain-containing protein n=1 Tax=Mycoemilia scoparia TaxID=417184 RepID=A0A9W7ZNP7_9FUNG|nr:hypothetical protein H4219_005260 [Mycoemilia scoparia]
MAEEKQSPLKYLHPHNIKLWFTSLPTNPHQQQGLIVLAASFIVSMFTVSLFSSMGVYQAYYLETMFKNESAAKISWITTTCVICLSGMMVVGGIIFEKIGPRFTILIGTNMMVLGYLLASFSTRIWQLILTQGLLVGTGAAFIGSAIMVVVLDYFGGGKGLAVGISSSGAGIGGMWIPPVTQALIDSVGIHWALRIFGFIIFAVCNSCAVFLKPSNPDDTSDRKAIAVVNGEETENEDPNPENGLNEYSTSYSVDIDKTRVLERASATICAKTTKTIERPGGILSCDDTILILEEYIVDRNGHSESSNSDGNLFMTLDHKTQNKEDATKTKSTSTKLPPYTENNNASHTVEDGPRGADQQQEGIKTGIAINGDEVTQNSSSKWWMLLDSKIIMDPPVWLLFWSMVFLAIGTNSITGYTIASANQHGITPTKSSLIPTVMGITHTIGNIISGMLADYVGAITIYLVSLVSSMIFTFAFWYPAESYAMFMILALAFGLVGMNTNNTVAIVVAQFYGLKRLPSTMGVVLLGSVVGGLCGNYAIAAVYDRVDHRKKFKFTILLTGIIYGVASLFGLAVSIIFYLRKRKGKLAII